MISTSRDSGATHRWSRSQFLARPQGTSGGWPPCGRPAVAALWAARPHHFTLGVLSLLQWSHRGGLTTGRGLNRLEEPDPYSHHWFRVQTVSESQQSPCLRGSTSVHTTDRQTGPGPRIPHQDWHPLQDSPLGPPILAFGDLPFRGHCSCSVYHSCLHSWWPVFSLPAGSMWVLRCPRPGGRLDC